MKILYYSPHPHLNLNSSTGYGRHMREMVSAFRKNGHEVRTLIIGGENSSESFPTNNNWLKKIAKKIIPSFLWETMKDYQLIMLDRKAKERLLVVIKEFNPDIIYERGFYLMPSGTAVAKEKKIKHILEINAPYIEERIDLQGKSMLIRTAKHLEKKQIKNTNLLVVVTTPLKNYFVKQHIISPSKILVTPNAANFDEIVIDAEKVNYLKNNFADKNRLIIGFVGSIFPYHGVDILIDSVELLKNKKAFNKCVLLIIGDGEILDELRQSVIKKGLQSEIIFTGKVPHSDIYNYIQLFDIAVMPKTNWYGSPIKIFEYGALQKPIIAPDTQSVRDVMTHNEDGILIEPEAEQIAIAIIEYLDNKEKRLQHGLSFYNKIKKNYTWEGVAKKILDNIK